jgi:hypothetical protein
LQDHSNFSQIGIFGLKTNHLATLISTTKLFAQSIRNADLKKEEASDAIHHRCGLEAG